MRTYTWETHSREETEAVGGELAALLRPLLCEKGALVLRLDGEMGVGKTTLTGGICRALGIPRTKSPTYTVVNEYRGEIPVFHFDFYRLADYDDLVSIGYEDYLARRGLLLVEWGELIPEALPEGCASASLVRTDDRDGRRITLTLRE